VIELDSLNNTIMNYLAIDHSTSLRRIILAALLGYLLIASGSAAAKPNVLLILADDLGFSDLGCFGGEIQTPHLDALAANGLRLTRLYNTGRCCPSRASLLTGQYPHRVGLGHMVKDLGQPGYRGSLAPEAQTIAERLQPAGYRSFMAGKWHLGTPDPTQHGFEAFYGTLISARSFWEPGQFLRLPASDIPSIGTSDSFYATDAVTDHALDFINQARSIAPPWFTYLAYHAPHFPLHARAEDIDRYKNTYQVGWDQVRQNRFNRMKQLGIISKDTELTPRSTYTNWLEETTAQNPDWTTLDEDRRADLARRMAIYAAMVENMDHNIGRVIDLLRESGQLENTLIIFLSDNGACAEWDPYGFDGASGPNNRLHHRDELHLMGGRETYHSVGSGWANASNTPWRYYKHYTYEGGISTPCIVHWPQGTDRRNEIDHQPAHIIDILPTLMELSQTDDQGTLPAAGVSLVPLLKRQQMPPRVLFFEHEGHRAVHDGRWKLTAKRNSPWQLFDNSLDRTELQDLASVNADVVRRLARQWQEWAEASFVLPYPKDYDVGYLQPEQE
jgi:arylsulfatase A-like enzyme